MSGDACPCGSGAGYAACCGPLHAGQPAADAKSLMRSRYSAYVLGRRDYLLATWHPRTRPVTFDLDSGCKWLGLTVRSFSQMDAGHASVEFVARWRIAGRGQRLHETSRFERLADGRWVYVDGDLHAR